MALSSDIAISISGAVCEVFDLLEIVSSTVMWG